MKNAVMGALAIFGTSYAMPVDAQHQDIQIRSMALEICDIDGFGGYGSYDLCVDTTYNDSINSGLYKFKNIKLADDSQAHNAWLDCRGTAEGDYCRIIQ